MMPTEPIRCPEPGCDDFNWRQDQDYQATDRHYLDWGPGHAPMQYNFTFQQRSTSDENTGPWECTNGHVAPDELQDVLDDLVA